ncbi:unnamed protein product [Paramecium octaurelia]|uniref:Armadillo-type fold n=1 Tax=Paramecium octaurelia TaxID=43137 RepID=A0A8S1YME0_PAROT|nr:unnamed protein product [Paramecium octaurelia]
MFTLVSRGQTSTRNLFQLLFSSHKYFLNECINLDYQKKTEFLCENGQIMYSQSLKNNEYICFQNKNLLSLRYIIYLRKQPKLLFSVEDETQIMYACWGLNYLSNNDDGQQYFSIKPAVVQKLTLLLNSQNESLIIPALKTIGNILTGNDVQKAKVLNTGVLKPFEMLLSQNYSEVIQREVCWSFSNIVAGTLAQVNQILKNDSLLKALFRQFQQGDSKIFKEMSYFLSNLINYTDLKIIDQFLTQYDCFQKISTMLDTEDEAIRRIILEGILEFSKKKQKFNHIKSKLMQNFRYISN